MPCLRGPAQDTEAAMIDLGKETRLCLHGHVVDGWRLQGDRLPEPNTGCWLWMGGKRRLMRHVDMTRQLLEEILRLVQILVARQTTSGPALLSLKEAAVRLGVGRTKLAGLIQRGDLRATFVGKRMMIPFSEIQRLARPEESSSSARRRGGRRKKSIYDALVEAETLRKLR